MTPSKSKTFNVSISQPPAGFPPLVRARLRELGLGRKVYRADLERVCGGYSSANHFLDKASKQGLLIPFKWGEYRVADPDVLDLLARIPLPTHQRFVSWALTLPSLTNRRLAFLAPRIWKFSDLNLDEPAPVLGLAPDDPDAKRPPPQWGAFLYDLAPTESWTLEVGEERVGQFAVPGWPDSMILVRANADPRWRATAIRWREHLTQTELEQAERALSTLRRVPTPPPVLLVPLGRGPPHRHRLVTPAWYEHMHRDALEAIARGLDA